MVYSASLSDNPKSAWIIAHALQRVSPGAASPHPVVFILPMNARRQEIF
jgi:hypothetical protein